MLLKSKASFFFLTLSLAVSSLFAQVHFENTKDLNRVFAKANTENKLIYIDCYTDWCGWCKQLDKKVFCAGKVADTINRYFVSVKLEMEKDSFGILLARKYTINGFPTALILNKKGQLVQTLIGYAEPEAYLNMLAPYLTNSESQPVITGYSENMTPDFPDFYLNTFPLHGKGAYPDSITVNAFIDKQPVVTDEISWAIIKEFYFMLGEQQQNRVIKSVPALNDLFGNTSVQAVLYSMLSWRATTAIRKKDIAAYTQTLQSANTLLTENKTQFIFYAEKERFENDSNWKGLALFIQQSIPDTTLALSPSNLNEYAWTMYEKCDDKDALKIAINWMENDVLKKDPQYAYWDTYAAVLYKRGDYTAAKKAAGTAIGIGNKTQEDVSETEKLLQKIENKKHNK